LTPQHLFHTSANPGAQPAVFLDRDGTLIREVGYLARPEQVELLPDTPAALKQLQACGYRLIVVSNQSGVARGYFTESDVQAVHHHLQKLLERNGVYLDALYYCPHHPEGKVAAYRKECRCRKPAPGMIEQACRDLNIDLSRSAVIGDKASDILLGRQLGLMTILVLTGYGKETLRKMGGENRTQPDHVCHSLTQAAQILCTRIATP